MVHGHRRSNPMRTPTYLSWAGMIQRVTNSRHEKYQNYGGRGITVCDRWRVFANFLADMGERPRGKTLERRDTEGNYEPTNCCWATIKQQNRNRNWGRSR